MLNVISKKKKIALHGSNKNARGEKSTVDHENQPLIMDGPSTMATVHLGPCWVSSSMSKIWKCPKLAENFRTQPSYYYFLLF